MTLQTRIAAGHPVFMVRLGFNSPNLVEFVAQLGFDAVMIDCEHTSASVERVEEMVRAARVAGIAAIVRPEKLDSAIITRYIECKATGLMVPHVDNAQAATHLCDIVRYAVQKKRDSFFVMAMIELTEAIESLDFILAVEGIDAFFVARGDLSKSMGYDGSKNVPAVREAADRAVRKIVASGKVAAAAGDMDNVSTVIQSGARLIYITIEDILREGTRAYRHNAGVSAAGKASVSY